jgi:hypothetical protein
MQGRFNLPSLLQQLVPIVTRWKHSRHSANCFHLIRKTLFYVHGTISLMVLRTTQADVPIAIDEPTRWFQCERPLAS